MREIILELIRDLWWQSESDFPWLAEFTSDFPQALNSMETKDFEQFFRGVIEAKYWYSETEIQQLQKYQKLVTFLKENFTDLKVYRRGAIEIEIFVVGKYAQGYLILTTKAIET